MIFPIKREMVSDYLLYTEADNRMSVNDDSENISHEDMMKALGITEEDLSDVNVEIE